MKVQEKSGDWIYISPVYKLEISNELNKEFQIGRVLFVNRKKIPFIRNRLGFPIVFSKICKNIPSEDFFNESNTFAILPFKGIPIEKDYECRQIIEEAVNILSFSQLGYTTRSNNSQFGILKQRARISNYILDKNKFQTFNNNYVESKVLPFVLNNEWKNFHKQFFFFDLISLISSSQKMQKKWKETIIRAATMAGKSMSSRDVEYSFLWNMIIVEMLLTEQGDKYLDNLPERAEAFIGWVGYWKENNYEEKIRVVYKKRCQFVHDGNSQNINVKDVLFSDNLVFNLMLNIINHIDIFPSKKSVIEFSDKVKAEKLLGVKPRIQPKTFKFIHKEIDNNKLQRI